nr:hypothetical protein [Tanacetum cinerariifolium]
MVIIVKDVLFSERNLRKIYLYLVLKMEFSKILLSHPMTIPTLIMLFQSHSLSIKTLVKFLTNSSTNQPPLLLRLCSDCLNPEPFNNQTVKELPPTAPSFDPSCYSEDGNSFTYDSTSNLIHDSPNVFNLPPQPPLYSCEFCGNDARYGHYCTPQVPFIYLKPCYNQDFNLPHDFYDFQQQDLCCENYESFLDEDIPKKIYSNPLFDEESISMKIDPHHFNVESDPIESLFNRDSSIISSSSKIDSLFDEFIEFVFENSDAVFESFYPFPIPVEDNDSLMEEIDLSFTLDDPMPSGIAEDDYESERGILILKELLSNNSL